MKVTAQELVEDWWAKLDYAVGTGPRAVAVAADVWTRRQTDFVRWWLEAWAGVGLSALEVVRQAALRGAAVQAEAGRVLLAPKGRGR